MRLEEYSKPRIIAETNIKGIIPLAGLSTTALSGLAGAAGLALGMAAYKASPDIVPVKSKLVLQD